MKKIFIGLIVFFAVVSVIFTVLPMGTLAYLPIGITILLALIALFVLKGLKLLKRLLFVVLIIAIVAAVVVGGKSLFVKDHVAKDKQFELKKEQSEKEDIKDLENLK